MGNRGTKRSKPSDKSAISGDEFKENEEKRLEDSGVEYISSGRGTGRIKMEKTKTPKKKKYTGRISSGRGTSSQ